MAQLTQLLLAALALLVCCAPASAIIGSDYCNQLWTVNWIVATQGPIFLCSTNSTVTFQWQSTTEHSVFQIPNDACPPSFDAGATDDFKFLASPSKVGEFTWQPPEKPGDYWVTSSVGQDCANGMKAQIRVMTPNTPVGTSSGRRGAAAVPLAAAGATALAALWLGL